VAISEPSTLLTDCLLAAVAFVLGVRLWAGVPGDTLARRLWAAAFLVGAAAAAAGGAVHGFRASLPDPLEAALWTGCLMAAALCRARRGARRAGLRAPAGSRLPWWLVADRGLAFSSRRSRYAAWAGLLDRVAALRLCPGGGALALPRMAFGLALVGAGLVVQRAGWGLDAHFNHNDVAHVLMTVALWPFYRAGRSMGNEPHAASGARFTRA
jgi:hypothetical protein